MRNTLNIKSFFSESAFASLNDVSKKKATKITSRGVADLLDPLSHSFSFGYANIVKLLK